MESVRLPASKSILNRMLVLYALSGRAPSLQEEALPHDVEIMHRLLMKSPDGNIYDVEDAGTVYRFLTAYLAIKPGQHLIFGSDVLNTRPIHPLVEVLKSMGAKIEYLKTPFQAPLQITGNAFPGGELMIDASLSSQFVSALMLISPVLQEGLKLKIRNATSIPYIRITTHCLKQFGIDTQEEVDQINIAPNQILIPPSEPFKAVERDWSSAAFWYAITAVTHQPFLLKDLVLNSIQGDKICSTLFDAIGVESIQHEDGLIISYNEKHIDHKTFDLKDCPDLAPAFIVACAMQKKQVRFYGLETLKNKESDRSGVLQNELQKLGINFKQTDGYWELSNNASVTPDKMISCVLNTYHDHRIAMAFAVIKMCYPNITIENPDCVKKSYPDFWKELKLHCAIHP